MHSSWLMGRACLVYLFLCTMQIKLRFFFDIHHILVFDNVAFSLSTTFYETF